MVCNCIHRFNLSADSIRYWGENGTTPLLTRAQRGATLSRNGPLIRTTGPTRASCNCEAANQIRATTVEKQSEFHQNSRRCSFWIGAAETHLSCQNPEPSFLESLA
jgi:hypothetical protein